MNEYLNEGNIYPNLEYSNIAQPWLSNVEKNPLFLLYI